MDLFQSKNVLSVEDYTLLMQVKEPLYIEKPGMIIIDEQGQTSIKKTNKQGLPIDQGGIFNWTMDIEKFRVKYPDIFIKLLYSIQNNLKDNGLINPRPYVCRTYRNNSIRAWHKHVMAKNVKPKNWYCCIYYMHDNWDTKFKGALRVSKAEGFTGESFDCLSNSFVAHNGYYGHAVDELLLGYKGDRDIFLTHWVTDELQ